MALGPFDLRSVAESLNLQAAEDLYAAVGAGDVRVSQVVGAVSRPVGCDATRVGFRATSGLPSGTDRWHPDSLAWVSY